MEAAEPLIKEENSKNFFMDAAGTETEAQVVITGPPASRTVIDNLKRLLTQRQHSRESDAENKEVVPSTGSDLESDLSFYSMLTSSTSDSDDDFLRTSPENRKSNKRRPKRNLSTSSTSSSSSLSPVRERRKRPKTSKRGVKRYDSQMIILEDWNPSKVSKSVSSPLHHHRHSPLSSQGDLSSTAADPLTTNSSNIVNINIMMNPNVKFDPDNPNNPSSSNKDSSTEDEHDHIQQHLLQAQEKKNGSSATNNNNVRGGTTRLRKTRRDRDRRRKHHNSFSNTDQVRCQVRPLLNHLNKPENYAVVIGNGSKIPKDIPKNNTEELLVADATIATTNSTAAADDNIKRVEEGNENEGDAKQVCRHEAEN